MPELTIALAQCRQSADQDDNRAVILRDLKAAASAGAQIVCFPETQTVGYRVDVTPTDAPVPVEALAKLHASVAKRCGELDIACILGTEYPHADGAPAKPYNSALVIDEHGSILGVHHKVRLTPLDAIAYSPGTSYQTFNLCGVRVGVVICYEGFRFAESTRECVRQGAQLVFQPQNNTTRPNDWKIPIHHAMIVTRAAENTVWFASCNCAYAEHQNSRSMIVAPDGRIHARTELKEEQLLVSKIDVDLATRAIFLCDTVGCADVLFADTVQHDEFTGTDSPGRDEP